MRKSVIVFGILSILYYLLLLFLYIQNVWNEFLFLFVLFVSFIVLLIFTRVFRKHRSLRKKMAMITVAFFLFFCYEFPLILYYPTPSHYVYAYLEPKEAIEGSRIYSIGINRITFVDAKSAQALRQELIHTHLEVLSIRKVTNKDMYGIKNRQLLTWAHLLIEQTPAETKKNVALYLGHDDRNVNTFLNRQGISGDSAGLSLALSGLYNRGDFQNHVPIAVTGAINKEGEVLGVEDLKEKIQIVKRANIPYMIIPSQNAEKVAKIQREINAEIHIFDVSNVEEAVRLINDLNEDTERGRK